MSPCRENTNEGDSANPDKNEDSNTPLKSTAYKQPYLKEKHLQIDKLENLTPRSPQGIKHTNRSHNIEITPSDSPKNKKKQMD
tara:strand:+ start:312 stop:560 length:249 start_codon:yes stop_codon:yes gene_type:complete